VGIPDGPTDVQIVAGQLVLRQFGGGADFDEVGVPLRFPVGLPLTPEAAVKTVFERTGVRTTAVPTAFDQFSDLRIGQYALCASWRIRLEHPVSVTSMSSGGVLETSELFVRHVPACFSDTTGFFVAVPPQPTAIVVRFPRDTTGRGTVTDFDSAVAPLVGPTRFERVMPSPGLVVSRRATATARHRRDALLPPLLSIRKDACRARQPRNISC
jgi:hypothetical protein